MLFKIYKKSLKNSNFVYIKHQTQLRISINYIDGAEIRLVIFLK